jgi:hypothetical protein
MPQKRRTPKTRETTYPLRMAVRDTAVVLALNVWLMFRICAGNGRHSLPYLWKRGTRNDE